jgi:cell division protein FtsZ
MDANFIKFDLPKEQSSIIKVIGVGGGGSNAVNHMYKQGINGVDFIVCNTDKQALEISPVPVKIQLGGSLTQGLGAGSIPEMGRNAAIESIDMIREMLSNNTKMVFITAGMGGGTGTGAAPVIAQTCKDMGILTVGIVTIPFMFEGKRKRAQAEEGLEELKKNVDCLLVITNDKLREIYGNLSIAEAFGKADNVLTGAAKSIAELISLTKHMNVDFNDVNTAMKNSGVALMGSGTAEGDNRALKAIEHALNSPLLNDNDIRGARFVLLDITSGKNELTMDEFGEITDLIQEATGNSADVKIGYGIDESLNEKVHITIIATGFKAGNVHTIISAAEPQKKYVTLVEEKPVVNQISSPTESALKSEEPFLKKTEISPVSSQQTISSIDEPVLKSELVKPQASIEFEINTSSEEKSAPAQLTIESPIAEVKPEWKEPVAQIPSTPVIETPKTEEVKSEISSTPVSNIPSTPVTETSKTEEKKKYYWLDDSLEEEKKTEENATESDSEESIAHLSHEEQQKRSADRFSKIKELSSKLKTPSGLADLENEPAYKRRNVTLLNTPHSSESTVSKYTVSEETDENGNKTTGLKSNNSFLHDNVD